MSTIPVAGESIYFYHYETSEHIRYNAIVRTAEQVADGEVNLSWFNEDGVESQANNVKFVEDPSLGATDDYWLRRYADPQLDLSWIGNSYLDTVRVEKGDMILFRKWDDATFWQEIYFAVVVSTLGAPTAPHPVINLRYINSSGTSILESNVSPLEGYDDEDDAQGNDLWSNIPEPLMEMVG